MQNSNKLNFPSKLKTVITIEFHTQYAANLIEGTNSSNNPKKFYIIGLLGFASKIKAVKKEMDNGNPYAAYYYKQAETKLDEAENIIKKTHEASLQIIKEAKALGISLSIAENRKPTKKDFSFKVDLCFQAAILLSKYDTCIRELQAIKQVGFISANKAEAKTQKMSKIMRSLFHSLEPFRNNPVTLADISEGNLKARTAYNSMGVVPGIDFDKLIYNESAV